MAPSPAAGRGRGSDVPPLGGEGKTLFGLPLRNKRGRTDAIRKLSEGFSQSSLKLAPFSTGQTDLKASNPGKESLTCRWANGTHVFLGFACFGLFASQTNAVASEMVGIS